MARGMVNGEGIVSQASTDEFREGYERTFGDKKPTRGRWVWDEKAQQLVPAEDYVPEARALDAPIMVDRFYENTSTIEGVDIGSRKKHRQYMKDRGLAPADDFSSSWYNRVRERQKTETNKGRREAVARALYKMDKP